MPLSGPTSPVLFWKQQYPPRHSLSLFHRGKHTAQHLALCLPRQLGGVNRAHTVGPPPRRLFHEDGLLTCHLPLPILSVPKNGVGDPHPRVVLAELGEQVVGYKPHGGGQDKQHDAEEGLQGKRASHHSAGSAGQAGPGVTYNTSVLLFPPKAGVPNPWATDWYWSTAC